MATRDRQPWTQDQAIGRWFRAEDSATQEVYWIPEHSVIGWTASLTGLNITMFLTPASPGLNPWPSVIEIAGANALALAEELEAHVIWQINAETSNNVVHGALPDNVVHVADNVISYF